MVHQDSVFDKVQDVVEVSQVSDVDNLSPEETRRSKGKFKHKSRSHSGG